MLAAILSRLCENVEPGRSNQIDVEKGLWSNFLTNALPRNSFALANSVGIVPATRDGS